MAFTQSQLDAIESAIGDGTLTVKYADKEVTYRSLNEMLRIRDLIKQSLGQTSSSASRVYPITSKGLE